MSDFKKKPAPGAPTKALTGVKRTLKGSVQLAPVPAVLVSCADGDVTDLVTVGWTGTVCTHPPMAYISLRPERFSYDIIKNSGEFVINLPSADLVKAVDWCGVRSGKTEDKWAHCGLTPEPCPDLQYAPAVQQCPVSVACRLDRIVPLGSHDMFLAEVVAVHADEKYMDEKNRFHLEKAQPVVYSHGTYYLCGEDLGTFGYSVRKKNSRKK
jgi:flavin reductase (DIM6/NTAB) family NADH-FMN oxidoreductase RutF